MPEITALLHTANDALRLGRALETLRPCDEIVVVDHASRDATLRIAHAYGARVLQFRPGTQAKELLPLARHDWILCLDPREALSEALEASLLEWKSLAPNAVAAAHAFGVFLRQERAEGWIDVADPQIRLVPRTWNRWHNLMPAQDSAAAALEGKLLRFLVP